MSASNSLPPPGREPPALAPRVGWAWRSLGLDRWAAATARFAQHAPWLWPYGVLDLALAVVLWPAWTARDLLILSGDTLLQHYPWQVFWRDMLAAGEFPFWNPYTLSGEPAFAN